VKGLHRFLGIVLLLFGAALLYHYAVVHRLPLGFSPKGVQETLGHRLEFVGAMCSCVAGVIELGVSLVKINAARDELKRDLEERRRAGSGSSL
jgi:hypothetical protein